MQGLSSAAAQSLLHNENISPECGQQRRDLCQYAQKGLEARARHQAHSINYKVFANRAQSRVSVERRSR